MTPEESAPNKFRTTFLSLVSRGATPRDHSGRPGNVGQPLVQNIQGYTLPLVLALVLAGLVLEAAVAVVVMGATGRRLASQQDSIMVEGILASGIDYRSLSAADIRARFSVTSEEGNALVRIVGNRPDLVGEIAKWLLSLPPERREPAWASMKAISVQATQKPGIFNFVEAILHIDGDVAEAVVEVGADIPGILKQLGHLPSSDRKWLIEDGFPSVPRDADRRRIWSLVNSADFPAVQLFEPLSLAINSHSTRLTSALAYLRDGKPLQQCLPVACQPVACAAYPDPSLSCKSGYYLTYQAACAPNPVRR